MSEPSRILSLIDEALKTQPDLDGRLFTPATIDGCTGRPPPVRQELWNGLVAIESSTNQSSGSAGSTLTILTAKAFINKLPFNYPFPTELLIGDDGDIILRWRNSRYDYLGTISGSGIYISEKDEGRYARRVHAEMSLYSNSIPDQIKGILLDMHQKDRAERTA